MLGQTNIEVRVINADTLLAQLSANHPPDTADAVLLYAVLEHQHPLERLETLTRCWDLLRPGGVLIVVETPNRIVYFDPHTSLLPFFAMLPPEVAAR
jgi:S-adenosylmethionine-dependent methyltransferase